MSETFEQRYGALIDSINQRGALWSDRTIGERFVAEFYTEGRRIEMFKVEGDPAEALKPHFADEFGYADPDMRRSPGWVLNLSADFWFLYEPEQQSSITRAIDFLVGA